MFEVPNENTNDTSKLILLSRLCSAKSSINFQEQCTQDIPYVRIWRQKTSLGFHRGGEREREREILHSATVNRNLSLLIDVFRRRFGKFTFSLHTNFN